MFTQRRVVREKGPGIMHLAIFWGMLFCILATTFVALQADFGLQILYGDFYLYFISLAVDLAGFVCIIGVVIALVRRLGKFNKNLENEPADVLMLVLLLVILVTGFVTEGLRIVGTNDPWAYWSPIGYVFSLMFENLDEGAPFTCASNNVVGAYGISVCFFGNVYLYQNGARAFHTWKRLFSFS